MQDPKDTNTLLHLSNRSTLSARGDVTRPIEELAARRLPQGVIRQAFARWLQGTEPPLAPFRRDQGRHFVRGEKKALCKGNMVYAYHRQRRRDLNRRFLTEARTLLERAIQLDASPTRHAWAWRELARTLRWLRAPLREIEAAYRRAIDLLPEETRFAQEVTLRTWQNVGRISEA